jgi:hypothetical protein
MEHIRMKPESTSPPRVAMIVTAMVMSITGAALYFWPKEDTPTPPTAVAPAPVDAPLHARPASTAHYPVPAPSDSALARKPLPALDASDAALTESLAGLFGMQTFARFFRPEALVRHIVATVDNLPRGTYSQRLSPALPVGGLLVTAGKDESLTLASGNAARYAPSVRLVEHLDPRRIVEIYIHFYPLFQQAYVELGYPDGYFNNRLVQVIDHLLDAPTATEPVRLVVRHVLPEFADPALESESAGRKILLRMGPDNAAIVKAKLRAIRSELTERTPAQ